MRQEMFQPFKGVFVKLVVKPHNFALYGTIDLLYEDALLFTTRQKSSLISYDLIIEVTPEEDKYKGRRNETYG